MKLNKIMTFFCIGMPICVLLRIFQIVFTIEFETGFYINDYKTIGKVISAVIFGFCIFLYMFCFRYFKRPENLPKANIILSVTSVALSVVTVLQAFFDTQYGITPVWQIYLIKVFGITTAIYFILFALSKYISFPPILHIIPCVFMILRTAFIFINTSALAHITDNVLLIATYCMAMLFFVNFAKLYNDVDNDKNFKKLLSSGLVSVVLCFVQSLSHTVINLASENRYLHVSHIANISTFLMGLFISVFIISYFCLSND